MSGDTSTLTFSSAEDGVYTFYVIASNAAGYATSSTATVTFAVVAVPSITSAQVAAATLNSPFTYTITATGLPTSFAATGLPAGLSINASTGVITGSATAAGTFQVTLSATNGMGTGTLVLTITAAAALPAPSLYAYEQAGVPGNGFFQYSTTSIFSGPTGVAVDSAGNIYVADSGSDTIRTITGTVIAGALNLVGNADGAGSTAHFFKPSGVAVDSSGTLYVTDTGNDTVRTISASGVVATLAGTPEQAGSADGTGSAALFNAPLGIAVDSGGNLYVADSGNQTVRKITPSGTVTTLAGSPGQSGGTDGTGSAARFSSPSGIAVDSTGNVYVADTGNKTVRRISPSGVTTTIAGQPGQSGSADGFGSAASFSGPTGIAVDSSGDVFVTDTANNSIREIFPNGYVATLSGWVGALLTPGSGPAPGPIYRAYVPAITSPTALAMNSSGNLYWLNGAGSGSSTPVNVFVGYPYTPVVITTPPQNVESTVGSNVAFSVSATGQNLDYAWYGPQIFNSNPLVLLATTAIFDDQVDATSDNGGYELYTNTGSYEVFVYNIGSYASASFSVTATAPPVLQNNGLPPSEAVVQGGSLTLSVAIENYGLGNYGDFYIGPGYSWNFNGVPIPGADSQTYTISDAQPSDAGSYSVTVYEGYHDALTGAGLLNSSVTSNVEVVTVNPSTGPQITEQPASLSVAPGDTATLSVAASGSTSATYQWYLNGVPIAGATASSYTIASATAADAGNYTVAVTTSAGTTLSNGAVVTVASQVGLSITSQPQAESVRLGDTATFSVTAVGLSPSYQWLLNGVPIAGATASILTIPAATTADAGSYTVIVSAGGQTVTSGAVNLDVSTTRLSNLSSRGFVGQGADILVAGFTTSGAVQKQILVRGIGPSLSSFDITDPIADPDLTLTAAGGTPIASNTGWGGTIALQDAFIQVGAFALPGESVDSALLETLPAGGYTASVDSVSGGKGVALVEVYDADVGTPVSRLINLSTRAFVGTGSNVLIVGFTIEGNDPETVLIRGVGPGLSEFGITGFLANPQLTLFDSSGNPFSQNAGWGGTEQLSALSALVGAFALDPNSADAAILVTLAPGSYTAELSGVGGTTGIGLAEIYEVP